MEGIERCARLGIKVSLLAVLMNVNYDELGLLAKLATSLRADFRVNVYQPMFTDTFLPTFDQYWQAYQILFDNSKIISVTEPLVNTFLGLNSLNGSPCGGRSLRITPDRLLKGCVYWPTSDLTIDDLVERKEAVLETPLFQQKYKVPRFCMSCEHQGNCRGGCTSRRMLRSYPHEPDEYCPIAKGKNIRLKGQFSAANKPLRTGSICTTIVRGT
jgi:radical SAM protein with 4Fe4S-binding SPASM domain